VYRGFEAVLELFGEWSGSWEDYRFEVEEIVARIPESPWIPGLPQIT
jgi:hypothetical protein